MSSYVKCPCGALFEPDTCIVCQEQRWIDEIEATRARVAELEGQVARAHRVEKRLRAYLLRIEKLATESHTEDPDN